jgi:hypothetical protein
MHILEFDKISSFPLELHPHVPSIHLQGRLIQPSRHGRPRMTGSRLRPPLVIVRALSARGAVRCEANGLARGNVHGGRGIVAARTSPHIEQMKAGSTQRGTFGR